MPNECRARPIAIDLFAGAGGLSLGFEQAGFDVAAAVEVDPVHACVHRFNFPGCAIVPHSISAVSGTEIRRAAGLSPSSAVDVVMGGAPCQGFSIMGPRAFNDPRNALVREFIRIVRELQPSYFLFENVKGLTIGRNFQFLEQIIRELNDAGYQVRQPWKILNAKDYGVPQSRERLFLIGAKKETALPAYPCAVDMPVTCADALQDLPDAEQFEQLLRRDEVRADYLRPPTGYSAAMRCSDRTQWKYGHPRKWSPRVLTSSRRTNHSAASRARFKHTPQGKREPISHFYKLSPDGVATTLRAGTDSARGAFTSPRPIHYQYARCVTVREMARLHGFPDWFRFNETKWHGGRQIGNSVPPPLGFAIAQEIMRVLPYEPVQPETKVALGDRALLSMTMSSASNYWGIDSPIGGRDRKTGLRKRKQEKGEILLHGA
ncbi:MAG: DNA cytosine methyltransferase [Cyanobacteria bacterium P01_D01_bin.105]